jgi:hypothetical protein
MTSSIDLIYKVTRFGEAKGCTGETGKNGDIISNLLKVYLLMLDDFSRT